MAKQTKNQKAVFEKIEKNKKYALSEAIELLKEVDYAKFDGSVEVAYRLGIDTK